jgi:hypothetical protein
MRRKGMILATLAVPTIVLAHVPTVLANGPLLSGYGGPGAGAQTIIGATLLNGPKGGAGGSSSANSSSSSSSLVGGSSASSPSNSSASSRGVGAVAAGGRRGSESGNGVARRAGGGGASAGSPSAHSNSSHPRATAASLSAEASWFTGGDLLALVLAAGVLALVAVATVRLAATHDG